MKTKTGLQQDKSKRTTRRVRQPKLVRVRAVEPLHDFWVHMTFTNNVERDLDLKPELWGRVFEPLRNNPKLFRQVYVDPVSRTLTWPGELDLDPDTLYYGDTPPWAVAKASQPKTTKRQTQRAASTVPTKTKARAVKSNGAKRVTKTHAILVKGAANRAK